MWGGVQPWHSWWFQFQPPATPHRRTADPGGPEIMLEAYCSVVGAANPPFWWQPASRDQISDWPSPIGQLLAFDLQLVGSVRCLPGQKRFHLKKKLLKPIMKGQRQRIILQTLRSDSATLNNSGVELGVRFWVEVWFHTRLLPAPKHQWPVLVSSGKRCYNYWSNYGRNVLHGNVIKSWTMVHETLPMD